MEGDKIWAFIAITLYLVSFGVISTAMQNSYSKNLVTTQDKSAIGTETLCFIKLGSFGLFCFDPTAVDSLGKGGFKIAISLNSGLWWVDLIFVGLPIIAWVLLLYLILIPTK